MAAVALGYKSLLTILGLLFYAWVIGGVVGMELLGGVASRACLSPASVEAAGLTGATCPRMLSCDPPLQCFLGPGRHDPVKRA